MASNHPVWKMVPSPGHYGLPASFHENPFGPKVYYVLGIGIMLVVSMNTDYKVGMGFFGVLFVFMGLKLSFERIAKEIKCYHESLQMLMLTCMSDHSQIHDDFGHISSLSPLEVEDLFASICFNQKDYRRAEMIYRKILSSREQEVGESHPWMSICYNDLARVLDAQGRYDEAEEAYRHAMSLLDEPAISDYPPLVLSFANYAFFLRKRWRFKEAKLVGRRIEHLKSRLAGSSPTG